MESATCSIVVEFSPDSGTSWFTATEGAGSDGISDLTASPSGKFHKFVWDSPADNVGISSANSQCRIRITPSDSYEGTGDTTDDFTADNTGFQPPNIDNLDPNSGAVGTTISINGQRFKDAQGASVVTFYDGVTAAISSWSDTQIICQVPAGATDGNVTVTVDGQVSNGVTFTVTAVTPPSITLIDPTYGPVGTTVTIDGSNFGAVPDTVTFGGGVDATSFTSWSDTQIVCDVPAGAVTGNVTVTVGANTSNGVAFTVDNKPVVTLYDPASGIYSDTIVFTYDLADADGEACDITVRYSDDGGASWYNPILTAASAGSISGNVIQGVSPGAGLTFTWDSRADNVGSSAQNDSVRVKIEADDGQLTSDPDETADFSVDNTNVAPVVTIYTPFGTQTGETELTCDLLDDNGDPCDITVVFSDDGGTSWYSATLTGSSAGTISGNVIQNVSPAAGLTFTWDSATDGVGASGPNDQVRIRIVANDGHFDSNPAETTNFTVNNQILRVPADYGTIQAAIDAAVNGATVLVADGAYMGAGNVNLDFGGKAITVKSENGASNCTIDCQNTADTRGFYFHSSETNAAVVEGFTIQNGNMGGASYPDNAGGAILCDASSPTIRNCVMTNNSADYGAGINCHMNSSPTITNCVITGNSAGYGGGIYCYSSSPAITNCTMSDNVASSNGGGILCYDGPGPTITNCTVANNSAADTGGGIYCTSSASPTLNNTILWSNSADNSPYGHQIHVNGVAAAVSLNYCDYSNSTDDVAGNGTVTPSNCISTDPLFRDAPGGNYRLKPATPCLDAGDDSVVTWSEDLDGNPRLDGLHVDIGAYELTVLRVTAEYGTIQDAIDAASDWDVVLVGNGTYTGAGNKNLDFGGRKIAVRSESGAANCIIDCENSGRGFHFYSGETSDSVVDGFSIQNGSTSYSGGIRFESSSSPTIRNCVIKDSTGTLYGGGINCCDSSPIIENCAIYDNTISAANAYGAGIYCSNSNLTITNCAITNNSATGTTNAGGGGIMCVSASPTITNCVISNNAASAPNVLGGGLGCSNSSPTLNNTIVWGSTASSSPYGHQIHVSGATVTLNYCNYGNGTDDVVGSVTANSCITTDPLFVVAGSPGAGGGGDYHLQVGSPCIDAGDDSLVPPGVTTDLDGNPRIAGLHVNIGAYESGALLVPSQYGTIQAAIDAASNGDVVLVADGTYTGARNKDLDFGGKEIAVCSENGATSCIIDCGASGRGFYFHSGETADSIVDGFTITNGSISGNGGGILCETDSNPTIENCVITNNSADDGGGVYCDSSNPAITNCAIVSNQASGGSSARGGGIYCYTSNPAITNSTIVDNSADGGDMFGTGLGGGIYCTNLSSPTFTNCTIAGNSAFDISPLISSQGGGIYCSAMCIPTLYNTILWGNTSEEAWQIYTSETITFNYCDYANGGNDIGGGGFISPNNCINSDPLFVNPGSANYRLQSTSPCIDMGNNDDVPAGVTTDLDGNTRIVDGDNPPDGVDTVDIGAYEYQP